MSKIDRLRSVWVVGASTGIGKALVRELDSAERTLYVSARNVSGLDQLRDRSAAAILPYPLDITDSVAVEKAAAAIGQSANGLDLLIVNAGTCEYIDSDRIDTDAVRRVLETNFLGAGSVVNASLPLLRRLRHCGQILIHSWCWFPVVLPIRRCLVPAPTVRLKRRCVTLQNV